MKSQDYILKLRSGHYAQALDIKNFTRDKYAHFFKNEMGADALLPLLVHEIANTNINEEDIIHLNNIYLLIQENELVSTEADYNLTIFASAVSYVLAATPATLQAIQKASLKSAAEIKEFTQSFNNLNNLTSDPAVHMKTVFSTKNTFSEVKAQSKHIQTPILQSVSQLRRCEQLKNTVSAYKINLENQLKDAVKIAEIAGSSSSNALQMQPLEEAAADAGALETLHTLSNLDVKTMKLMNRYNAVSTLEQQLRGHLFITPKIKQQVKETINLCKKNEPSWFERNFLDKLTDFLSFGIKPLIRLFFQKNENKQYNSNLEQSIVYPHSELQAKV